MNRRQFLAAAASTTTGLLLSPAARGQTAPASQPSTRPVTQPAIPPDLVWHDLRDIGVEGRAFNDTERYYDRLPARAKGIVREPVWDLSRHTAGMSVRFQTDSPSLFIRYELLSETLAMPHMPATGVSGVDLYGMTDRDWNWLATTLPRAKTVEATLADGIERGFRSYLLHLPLYNGVVSMKIGHDKNSSFGPIAPRTGKPILFYGTSITQGGCASRPGMAFTNILGRRLDAPMLNFGFSGNGKMEIEVATFLSELDPVLFVNDCMANTTLEQVKERVGPMTRLLRERHPTMPILFVEDRIWSDTPLRPERQSMIERKRVLRGEFDKLVQAGVEHLHYKAADDLLGTDNEATVDGSHPSDLGMLRYADALESVIRSILKK